MFQNYAVAALRSLKTNRIFALINVCGLAIGLAAVLLIGLFVRQQLSVDQWIPEHERIFRLDTHESYPGRSPLEIARAPGPVKAALLNDFQAVEAVVRTHMTSVTVRANEVPRRETVMVADADFFSFMGLPMAHGVSAQALRGAASLAISRSKALQLFGTENAIGETVTVFAPDARDFKVAGVFEDIPAASHMAFDIVLPISGYFYNGEDEQPIPERWNGAYFHTYLKLSNKDAADIIRAALPDFVDRHLPAWIVSAVGTPAHEFYRFQLTALANLHFDGGTIAAMKPPGNRTTVFIFSAIALLILIVAGLNFISLTHVQLAKRRHEVAIRKVVGAERRHIIGQFIGEAGGLFCLAFLMALGLVELALPYHRSLFEGFATIDVSEGQGLRFILFAIVGLAALLASALPAIRIAALPPLSILGRGQRPTNGGRRNLQPISIFQFAIAIALISAAIVIHAQTRFLNAKDLGFSVENIIILHRPETVSDPRAWSSMMERLRAHPNVSSLAASSAVPGIASDASEANWSITIDGTARPISLGIHEVDQEFFQTYGVAPVAGRVFGRDFPGDTFGAVPTKTMRRASVVLNRKAAAQLGFPSPDEALGAVLRAGDRTLTVVGVVDDLNFRSLRREVREEMFIATSSPGQMVSIRHQGQASALLADIKTLWSDALPERAIRYDILTERLDALYEQERQNGRLVGEFAVLAAIIAGLGFLGMAMAGTERSMREVALRKIMGAEANQVSRLLFWRLSKPIFAAALIACPLAWVALDRWLQGYAFRIELTPLPFAAATAAVTVIALLVIGAHTLRIARAKPIEALRSE